MFNHFAQRVSDHLMPTNSIVDKRVSIERLKASRAMTFEGTTDLANVEKWLSLIEMFWGDELPRGRKSKISNTLLQGSAKNRWTLHATKVGGVSFVTWEEFREAFQNKFYPHSFSNAKKNEFMSLVQSDMTVI